MRVHYTEVPLKKMSSITHAALSDLALQTWHLPVMSTFHACAKARKCTRLIMVTYDKRGALSLGVYAVFLFEHQHQLDLHMSTTKSRAHGNAKLDDNIMLEQHVKILRSDAA